MIWAIQEAVQAFVSAGNEVTLKIISNHYNNIIEHRQKRNQVIQI